MLMSLSERLSNARGTFEAGQELVAELMEKTEAKATARAQQASTIIVRLYIFCISIVLYTFVCVHSLFC